MANLNSILNWLIPVLVLLIFAGIFYNKMKKPIDHVLSWIGKLFRSGADKLTDKKPEFTTIYRYG